ncbi:MAG: LysM peptidoglycan-binding domain-containing protein [Thermodesulfobacteriota bacterium]|nr:LysM peptidoglycan-binding domain-containing protein [Thermodesulfobacteriota bacterium]
MSNIILFRKNLGGVSRFVFWAGCSILLIFLSLKYVQAQAKHKEKTYSISLVKTAEIQKDLRQVGDTKVLTQVYTVKTGDHVSKIFRKKGLAKHHSLRKLLSLFKQLNPSLSNIDLIHPGEKIIIPLKVVPFTGDSGRTGPSQPEKIAVSELKDMDLESYTVKPGDSLSKVIVARYDITRREMYGEYLELVKQFNPAIKDLNLIYPGQKIRLPIYCPEVIRRPIAAAISPKRKQNQDPLSRDLSFIFLEIGEEWIQTGRHFIPLKSGGQIDLGAMSFPIINLKSGQRVIVDLHSKLPDEMAKIIESNWTNYHVVRLGEKDNLRSSLDKILRSCNYPKVFKKGEFLQLGGDIPLKITGDWIVTLPKTSSYKGVSFVVIDLIESYRHHTPRIIKDYLKKSGIRIIDYPPADDNRLNANADANIMDSASDPSSLIESLLNLTGQTYSTNVEIPAFRGQKTDFKLIVKADFFLKIKGSDAVIDLTGLDPVIISLLNEHQILVLSMAREKEPLAMVARTLDFLGVQYYSGPKTFMAVAGDGSRNITFDLSGVIFSDTHGNDIFVTPLRLPHEIAIFLSQKGYKIFVLPNGNRSAKK